MTTLAAEPGVRYRCCQHCGGNGRGHGYYIAEDGHRIPCQAQMLCREGCWPVGAAA